jgi:hypothetical protein
VLGLVDVSVRLDVVEVDVDVLRVHQAHHTVDAVVVLDQRVAVEREHDGRRVRQTRRLDDDRVELLTPCHEHPKRAHQVAADRAAHTPVVHGDDVLLRGQVLFHQVTVDLYLPKLVLNHANLPILLLLQDVVDQGRLAAPQETRDDRHRSLVALRNILIHGGHRSVPVEAK